MALTRSLISPTVNLTLERTLREALARRASTAGGLGRLEPIAVRIGLIQESPQPRLVDPQLLLFAADHGLAIDIEAAQEGRSTATLVQQTLSGRLAAAAFARLEGIELTIVDAGVAESLAPHPRLLARKIAHGTRNARIGNAMSVAQAHAAIRAGMEIGHSLPGNARLYAGLGVGGIESAALVIARLSGTEVAALLTESRSARPDDLELRRFVARSAHERNRDVSDPVEVLAAFGGFDVAMMVGAMMVGASKRQLLVVDGLPACAALLIASRIAPATTDYCVFCRSSASRGLDAALALFQVSALLDLAMECPDGTGAALAWPLLRGAAALLSDSVGG